MLDHHRGWGNPRQAVANALWIVFLLAVLTLVVAAIGLLRTRHNTNVR